MDSPKPLILAIVVGVVFAGGIGIGLALAPSGSDPAKTVTVVSSGTTDTRHPSPPVTAGPTGAPRPPVVASATGGGAESGDGVRSDPTPVDPSKVVRLGVPPAPPPISNEALAEGERIKRELAENPEGNGTVTALVPGGESPEERAAWEKRKREQWENRLARENEIKLRQLRDSVGLQPAQEAELQRILADELTERTRLVNSLTAKEISRTSFDEGVRRNVEQARSRLRSLLTPEQYAAYGQLKPREQVLRDELK